MQISSIYIGQKFIGTDHKEHIVASIHEDGTIITKDNKKYHCDDIKPLDGQPYVETDAYGHTSLCIQCEAGTLIADADIPIECGYTAMYLAIKPVNQTETIDLACVRHNTISDKPTKDITIKVFSDVCQEDPTHEFNISHNDIQTALN